jgi:hypothetical protein
VSRNRTRGRRGRLRSRRRALSATYERDSECDKKSLRMIAAASLSTRRRVSSRVRPWAQSRDLASYDVARSSWRKTGMSSDSENLWAMRRASVDISLSLPFDSSGKPTTSALASNSETISLIFDSNLFQLVRCMTGSGRVVNLSSSQTATPQRFVPGSRLTILPFSGSRERSAGSLLLTVSFCCT